MTQSCRLNKTWAVLFWRFPPTCSTSAKQMCANLEETEKHCKFQNWTTGKCGRVVQEKEGEAVNEGSLRPPKWMNFWKISEGGGRRGWVTSDLKNFIANLVAMQPICQKCMKKLQYIYRKRPFKIFPQIHPFRGAQASLSKTWDFVLTGAGFQHSWERRSKGLKRQKDILSSEIMQIDQHS